MRYVWRLGFMVALLPLMGCGQELLGGGQRGEVEAVVRDEGEPSGSSASFNRAGGGSYSGVHVLRSETLEGTVAVDATVTLVRDGGATLRLAQVTPGVTLRIGADESAALARDSVLVGSYVLARVTFTRVEGNVTAGLRLPIGIELTGRVAVPTNELPVTVEAAIPLLVQKDGKHQLVIDLNAADWLVLASPGGVVPAAAFAGSVRIGIR